MCLRKRDPSHILLTTLLHSIVVSINHEQLSHIFEYRDRIREHHSIDISKKNLKDYVYNQRNYCSIVYPRTDKLPCVRKRCICMGWCIFY